MQTELSQTLATEIASKHDHALAVAHSAKETISTALHAAADVGQLIEQAKEIHHAGLTEWLAKHVPGMSLTQAKTYVGIHKVRQSRDYLGADSRQLKLMGIIGELGGDDGEGDATNKGQRAGGDRWVKWVGHVVHHFRDIEAERPIEQWGQHERETLVAILKPIAELYDKAAR